MTDVGAAAHRGRNKVSPRALERVVSAVTADAMGVSPRNVGVDLADDGGELSVTASTAVSIISLTARGRKALAASQAGSIIERATTAQQYIREQVRHITGSTIGQVNVRLNAANLNGEERVR